MAATDTQPFPSYLDLVDIDLPTRPAQQLVPSRLQRALTRYDAFERSAVEWMALHGTTCLRVSLATVFFWFGALKVVGLSPATELVAQTVWWWDAAWFVPVLGIAECLIGVCFLVPRLNRLAILLMAGQMLGTFTPFLWLPQETFHQTILVPTMEGQYIIKNFVLIAAAIAIGSRLRDEQ